MTKRIGKFRRKTRSKLKKPIRGKGKISIQKYTQEFNLKERVLLKANPTVQNGMYFPRFHGKTGVIKGRQGKCYKVSINDKGKEKIMIVHPIHLIKCQK